LRLVDERDDIKSELIPPELTTTSKGLEYVLTKGIEWMFRVFKSETKIKLMFIIHEKFK